MHYAGITLIGQEDKQYLANQKGTVAHEYEWDVTNFTNLSCDIRVEA